MTRDEWFPSKFRLLKRFGLLALAGLAVVAVGAYLGQKVPALVGLLLIVPVMFWVGLVPVLHWRERYLGRHSTAWGAFLVFETSSWSKLYYWFRHVLPDYRAQARYKDVL